MTKFCKERCDRIIASIAKRVPYSLAAEANGIGEETLYGWLRDGLRDIENGIESEKAAFSEAIKRVEEDCIQKHMDEINQNPNRWQAQAWILERRWWQHFSPVAANIEMNKKIERMARNGVPEKDVSDAKEELSQINTKT